ncbi:MAG TPA: phage protease [Nitrospiraceae bacterium]
MVEVKPGLWVPEDRVKEFGEPDVVPHFYLVNVEKAFAESDVGEGENVRWVEAFKFGKWRGSDGEVENIDKDFAEQVKSHFDNNTRGIDLAINYEHGTDPARGKEAAGWIKGMKVLEDGMQWAIEWTEQAVDDIKSGKFKYLSPEWLPKWEHNGTQEMHDNVPIGGALTNRPIQKGIVAVNFAEILTKDTTMEVADWEHSEPGQGGPIPGNPGAEPMAPPPPSLPVEPRPLTNPREGSTVDEAELRKLLGISDDVVINDHLTSLMADAKAFAEADKAAAKARKFAEDYPDEYKVQQTLLKKSREADAKSFAESYERVKLEGKPEVGLSPVAVEAIKEFHEKFDTGDATSDDLKAILDAVIENGIVKFGEAGSSHDDGEGVPSDPQQVIKEFAEKMAEFQRNGDEGKPMSAGDAMAKAAKEMPDHYEVYRDRGVNR